MPVDPLASQRAELLGQIVGAQFEIERALADLPVGIRAEGEHQLHALKHLQRQIGSASPASLHSLRADITAAVASAHGVVAQGRTIATAETVAILAEAALASREQVKAAMENMHRYDAFLQFGPGDSEADYRKREAERRAYIETEQAKHTPQGDLNAAGGVVGQMVDAKAHGASDSPKFKAQWDALVSTTERLRAEVQRSGGSTAEFDKKLRADLREILKAKGLTGPQIDAQFAAYPIPLEAAKAFVANDCDLQTIRNVALRAVAPTTTIIVAADAPPTNFSMADAMAQFRSAGIVDTENTGEVAHGVATKPRPSVPGRAVPG